MLPKYKADADNDVEGMEGRQRPLDLLANMGISMTDMKGAKTAARSQKSALSWLYSRL